MRKHCLLFVLATIIVGLVACDPGYRIYICNNTSASAYIKTYPSIESIYRPSEREPILQHEVSQEGKYSIYEIKRNDTFQLLGTIGFVPTVQDFPFDYLSIVSIADTIVLDSREAVFQRYSELSKRQKKSNYYIEVRK
jgi:hypothetical protein